MSLALHELLVCCRGLENDKATERKKEVEKFRQLIRSADTVEQLDQNSESRHSKHSKQLNWDAVFRFLQRFIRKETECLQSGKANVSTTTQANRQKKMQEISSLIKYFIRCANKRGPRLKCMELLSHIMEVLRDSYSCNAYGADYSSILLKDILSVRKYWCEITQQQWTDLLDLYCGLYLKASKDIDRVLLARILHTLVRGSCLQTEGLTHSLFEFFSKALPNARHEKILAVLEHMLAALNVFLKASAMNCRVRVCKLGEDLLPTVLYIWTQKRPQDLLKDEIIQFFCLQLRVHHPKGAKTQETGAYAEDWSKWQSLLYNLYDALVSEINQIGSRGKYSTGSRHVAVKENLIELTADICHQLFTQDTRVLEITQSHMCGTQRGTQQGTPSKRRRIQLGWEVIRDNLQRSQSDFDLIPWLQIIAVLVWKYPSILPSAELVPLLTALHQLLVQQRRGEKTPYVVRCLSNIAACQSGKKDLWLSQKPELQKLWTRLWAVTLRYVSSQQIETEAFGLLEAIIQGGLIPIDREFWKIFTGSACKPSFAAAQCLARALTKCAVPERLETGLEYMAAIEGNGPPSLREAILRWILLHQMDEDTEESTKPHPIIAASFAVKLFKAWMIEKDANAVTSSLRKANLDKKLLELFPASKQNVEHFSKYFNDAGLKELSDFLRTQKSLGTRKELQKDLQQRLSQECPIKEMVLYVKEEMKRNELQEQAVIGLLWSSIMHSVEWNKKEELVTEQALKHLKHYAPLLAVFSTQGQSELILLQKIQEYCYDNIHFMKSFHKIVVLFYKADVLSEEAILKWYKEAHVAKGKSVFLEQMKKFVEWLQNAEEESESEGDDNNHKDIVKSSQHLSVASGSKNDFTLAAEEKL